MPSSSKLREHAATCKRLAADSEDRAMIMVLEQSAEEYEAEALRLEGRDLDDRCQPVAENGTLRTGEIEE